MSVWTEIEDYVRSRIAQHHIPGMALSVVRDGAVVFAKGFGVRDVDRPEPVDPETIFGIGSITKSFAVLALLQLCDEGVISLDDPVIRHIPEFSIKATGPPEGIRIRHLISHGAGTPPLPGLTRALDKSVSEVSKSQAVAQEQPGDSREHGPEIADFESHLRYLSGESYEPLGPPGTYFSYSNDSFVVAAYLVERVEGRSFYQTIVERVLRPLGMTRTVWTPEEMSRMGNHISLHATDKRGEIRRLPRWPEIGPYAASGELKSTVMDMVRHGSVFPGKKGLVSPHISSWYPARRWAWWCSQTSTYRLMRRLWQSRIWLSGFPSIQRWGQCRSRRQHPRQRRLSLGPTAQAKGTTSPLSRLKATLRPGQVIQPQRWSSKPTVLPSLRTAVATNARPVSCSRKAGAPGPCSSVCAS